MRKHKVIQTIKFLASVVVVFVLAILVCKASYALVTGSVAEHLKIDKTTSNYLSFNYVDENDHMIEVSQPKKMSDFRGKRMFSNNYFDFEVSIPEEYVKGERVTYEIIATDLGNSVDGSFVKFYLTDQNNDVLDGYSDVVPVYSALADTVEGKILYSGEFTKNDLSDKYRLRIWVSKDYDKDIKDILAYHIQVKIK